MKTQITSLVLVAALYSSAAAEERQPDRSKNTAPSVDTFPRSVKPDLHGKLLSILKGQSPFDDKRVLKIAVTTTWGPWSRSYGVLQQYLVTAVGVYDAQNAKCWLWNVVEFYRQRGDARIHFAGTNGSVNEIDCAKLR